jgi:hypothetical protein
VVVGLSVAPMVWKWWTHRRAGETPREAVVTTAAGIDPEPKDAGTMTPESTKP